MMKKKDYYNILYLVLVCITILVALTIGRNFGWNAGIKHTRDYYEQDREVVFRDFLTLYSCEGVDINEDYPVISNINLEVECKTKEK